MASVINNFGLPIAKQYDEMFGQIGKFTAPKKYFTAVQDGVFDSALNSGLVNSQSIGSASTGQDSLLKALTDWYNGLETNADQANLVAQTNATAAQNYNTSERLAAEAFNENAYKHRYQWTYDDMKAAGINPIIGLASMGVGASPTSTPASVSAAQTFKRDRNIADDVIAIAQIFSSLISSVTGAFKK